MGPLALYRKHLKDKGIAQDSELFKTLYSAFYKEHRRKITNKSKRKGYKKQMKNSVSREKLKVKARESAKRRYYRMKTDPELHEKYKERQRLRKRRIRNERKEETNAKQRDYYARNKERVRATIYRGKDRRNPTRGLSALERKFQSGEINFGEYVRGLKSALIQLDALTDGDT